MNGAPSQDGAPLTFPERNVNARFNSTSLHLRSPQARRDVREFVTCPPSPCSIDLMNLRLPVLLLTAVVSCTALPAAPNATLKSEPFDHDPNWDSFNNHTAPGRVPTVIQDFGYTNSSFAGQELGEIGGKIWRSATPASYAANIRTKTLSDKLTASGTFSITSTSGSSGVFFGWFNSSASVGRQNTLGFRLAGQGGGARLTLQLVTAKNQACGTKITPWIVDKSKPRGEGRKYRPTSIKNDGTRYHWKLSYDPSGNNGTGTIQFSIVSNHPQPEDFETKTFTVPLPKGYKDQGTAFDRFGLRNAEKGGNSMTIYFDYLEINGQKQDLSKDPQWIGSGNRIQFQDRTQGGAHNYGFSPDTNHAGGKPGEVGGIFWRSGRYSYYADRVGALTLNDRLEAHGKVDILRAPPDSGMYIGWFNSADRSDAPTQTGSFLGIRIGGPTRVGHYFVPSYATAHPTSDRRRKRLTTEANEGPLLTPNQQFDWKLLYNPVGNNNNGAIEVTLGNKSVTLPLRPGDKTKGATFDRFGLFTSHIGGSFVEIYFDDLQYTALPAKE